MLPPSPYTHNGALSALECGLTAIAVIVPLAWPRLGARTFARMESIFRRFARRKSLAVLSVGLSCLLLRIAILPLFPIPTPFSPDDFSFLLSADTFAHGRLASPTPAMWAHFESIHISMRPTYGSMYFPGNGLLLAAGKVLLGHPWYGVLICSALMCAGICWMLQAWLPPGWALLGGVLAMLRLGLFSYWINTYTGGGTILALGGALMLGSLPRLMKAARPRFRYGVLMAIGVSILALTRPYEGLLLCLPIAIVLGHWAFFGINRPHPVDLIKLASVPLALTVATLAWLGYYDYRAFRSPLTLPYTVNRATYAIAPYFVWQSQRPEPAYRHQEMHSFYQLEAEGYCEIRASFVSRTLQKVWYVTKFFAGYALLPPLLLFARVFFDRRVRFLVLCLLVLMAGMLISVYLIPHYVAPFTAAFYALGLQAMRHLRLWAPEGKPIGVTIVRLTVALCIVLAGMRFISGPLKLRVAEWPAGSWVLAWSGPEHFGTERAQIENHLEQLPGKQLAIVRYARKREPMEQWIYNSADIDNSKVVWTGEVEPESDRALLNYYHDRTAWLVEPDEMPAKVSPYPVTPGPLHASR